MAVNLFGHFQESVNILGILSTFFEPPTPPLAIAGGILQAGGCTAASHQGHGASARGGQLGEAEPH